MVPLMDWWSQCCSKCFLKRQTYYFEKCCKRARQRGTDRQFLMDPGRATEVIITVHFINRNRLIDLAACWDGLEIHVVAPGCGCGWDGGLCLRKGKAWIIHSKFASDSLFRTLVHWKLPCKVTIWIVFLNNSATACHCMGCTRFLWTEIQ